MTLANDYFMAKWPNPAVPIVTDRSRPGNIWTRATYYEGLMALYKTDPKDAYYNYAVQWGEGHNWEPAYGGPRTTNADNQLTPQAKPKVKNANNAWWWIDAIQMAMPVFAKSGTFIIKLKAGSEIKTQKITLVK